MVLVTPQEQRSSSPKFRQWIVAWKFTQQQEIFWSTTEAFIIPVLLLMRPFILRSSYDKKFLHFYGL